MSNAYKTGNSRQVAVRLPIPLFAEIERIQAQHDRTQTEVVIALIRAGIGVLDASRAPAPPNTRAPEQGTNPADTIREIINRNQTL